MSESPRPERQIFEAMEDMARRMGELLPPGAAQLKTDFENNARATLQSTLGKMDLVTREEFDIQQRVLEKTRARLQALEERLAKLEGGPSDNDNGSGSASN